MSILSELINGSPVDSVLLFIVTFVLLISSGYLGKYLFKRRYRADDRIDDEAKIILGAILSLLGLLIGFILSVAISGYNNRQQAEENETIAINNALLRTELLPQEYKYEGKQLVLDYLDARIAFFETGVTSEHKQWKTLSEQKQTALWQIAIKQAEINPNGLMASVLTAYNDLYISQQKTAASWRHQIPNAAWILLILFAICSNVLLGYNIRGISGKNWLMLIMPLLITLALFVIAEIDVPGEGIIHVTPDNLLELKTRIIGP